MFALVMTVTTTTRNFQFKIQIQILYTQSRGPMKPLRDLSDSPAQPDVRCESDLVHWQQLRYTGTITLAI